MKKVICDRCKKEGPYTPGPPEWYYYYDPNWDLCGDCHKSFEEYQKNFYDGFLKT